MPLVFVLILLTAPGGQIVAHLEGTAPTVDECRATISKELKENPPPRGLTAHTFCLNMTPLPTGTNIHPEREPPLTL